MPACLPLAAVVVCIFRSAHILPRVQEDALVEHGVHVGRKLILLLEVLLVDRPGARMHTTPQR
jgi:hypothetical protein